MKKLLLILSLIIVSTVSMAQTDTTAAVKQYVSKIEFAKINLAQINDMLGANDTLLIPVMGPTNPRRITQSIIKIKMTTDQKSIVNAKKTSFSDSILVWQGKIKQLMP